MTGHLRSTNVTTVASDPSVGLTPRELSDHLAQVVRVAGPGYRDQITRVRAGLKGQIKQITTTVVTASGQWSYDPSQSQSPAPGEATGIGGRSDDRGYGL